MTNQEVFKRVFQDTRLKRDSVLTEESEKRRLENLTVEEVISGLIPNWIDSAYEEGTVYRIPCVFHANVRTPRGTLALDFYNDRFNCHSCQAGGSGGFNFARNLVLRELKGDFSQIHITQDDYLLPDVLNKTFDKLRQINPEYLSEEQKKERQRIMNENLARENERKIKGRKAANIIWKQAFPFPSGRLLKDNPKYRKSAAYLWGISGQKRNAVDYSKDYPNLRITARAWKGYMNKGFKGCILAPLLPISEWEMIFNENGIVNNADVFSIHWIAVDKDGEKAVNLNVEKLAKKDNKMKTGRKMLESDSSAFMLQGNNRNKLIICEGLGDALALHKLYDCFILAPIGVIGKLSKHSNSIAAFCMFHKVNQVWLMPDNDAGLNMLNRFAYELKLTINKFASIHSWILADSYKQFGLDPAEVVSNLNYDAKKIFEDNLVIHGVVST